LFGAGKEIPTLVIEGEVEMSELGDGEMIPASIQAVGIGPEVTTKPMRNDPMRGAHQEDSDTRVLLPFSLPFLFQ
jgi:hypothetical protein